MFFSSLHWPVLTSSGGIHYSREASGTDQEPGIRFRSDTGDSVCRTEKTGRIGSFGKIGKIGSPGSLINEDIRINNSTIPEFA